MNRSSWSVVVGLSVVSFLPMPAEAQGRPIAAVAYTLTVVVPSIIQLVVDSSVERSDGRPVIRVLTNDPVIRARSANGIPGEPIQFSRAGRGGARDAKGSDGDLGFESEVRWVRFTQVAP
jgi:hypothetical protein